MLSRYRRRASLSGTQLVRPATAEEKVAILEQIVAERDAEIARLRALIERQELPAPAPDLPSRSEDTTGR